MVFGLRDPEVVQDNVPLWFGKHGDGVIVLNSGGLSADAELTGVIVGTSDHQGVAANSIILSNTAIDGDIIGLVNDGGNSKEWVLVNADTADLQIGHGMATVNIKAPLDMNSNPIENIGNSGNDWTGTSFTHAGDMAVVKSSGFLSVDFKSGDNAVEFAVGADENNGNGTAVDAVFKCRHDGSTKWMFGNDASVTNGFAIGTSDLGSNDALRITNASPPVISFHTGQGSDFDYVCGTCGRHEVNMFPCCGLVEWHDDVMDWRAMALRESPAMDYMERVGVIQRGFNDEGKPEVFTALQMVYFVGSMAYQNRVRMDGLHQGAEHRIEYLEAEVSRLKELVEA